MPEHIGTVTQQPGMTLRYPFNQLMPGDWFMVDTLDKAQGDRIRRSVSAAANQAKKLGSPTPGSLFKVRRVNDTRILVWRIDGLSRLPAGSDGRRDEGLGLVNVKPNMPARVIKAVDLYDLDQIKTLAVEELRRIQQTLPLRYEVTTDRDALTLTVRCITTFDELGLK